MRVFHTSTSSPLRSISRRSIMVRISAQLLGADMAKQYRPAAHPRR
jgi:hypothetical protein